MLHLTQITVVLPKGHGQEDANRQYIKGFHLFNTGIKKIKVILPF